MHRVVLQFSRTKHQNTCEIPHQVASAEAEELVRAAYLNFATILAESIISFEPSPPSSAHLRRICRPAELVVVPNYQKQMYGVPPFTSTT
jgi:hypothetical protein